MSGIDLLLLLAFVVGLAAGGFLIARSPAFWLGMLELVVRRLWPYLMKLWVRLKLPLDPKNQAKLDKSRRMAEEWDFSRKTPKS